MCLHIQLYCHHHTSTATVPLYRCTALYRHCTALYHCTAALHCIATLYCFLCLLKPSPHLYCHLLAFELYCQMYVDPTAARTHTREGVQA